MKTKKRKLLPALNRKKMPERILLEKFKRSSVKSLQFLYYLTAGTPASVRGVCSKIIINLCRCAAQRALVPFEHCTPVSA